MRLAHNNTAWLAWHIESLSRQKNLPPLKSLLFKVEKPKQRQSWEEQLAIAQAWTAAQKRK